MWNLLVNVESGKESYPKGRYGEAYLKRKKDSVERERQMNAQCYKTMTGTIYEFQEKDRMLTKSNFELIEKNSCVTNNIF